MPADWHIELRIGINVGDIITDDNDIYGDGVSVAARLEAFAEPGGISVSRVVRDQLDFTFEDMGEQQAKTIARPLIASRLPRMLRRRHRSRCATSRQSRCCHSRT